jgi:hypothetical protein
MVKLHVYLRLVKNPWLCSSVKAGTRGTQTTSCRHVVSQQLAELDLVRSLPAADTAGLDADRTQIAESLPSPVLSSCATLDGRMVPRTAPRQ